MSLHLIFLCPLWGENWAILGQPALKLGFGRKVLILLNLNRLLSFLSPLLFVFDFPLCLTLAFFISLCGFCSKFWVITELKQGKTVVDARSMSVGRRCSNSFFTAPSPTNRHCVSARFVWWGEQSAWHLCPTETTFYHFLFYFSASFFELKWWYGGFEPCLS